MAGVAGRAVLAAAAGVRRRRAGGARRAPATPKGQAGRRMMRAVEAEASGRRERGRVAVAAAAAVAVAAPASGVLALRGAATVARPSRAVGLQVFCKKSKSILKRQRQNERDRLLNKARKTRMRTTTKKALEALEACALNEAVDIEGHDEFAAAEKLVGRAISAIDQARSRNVIHRNTASRRKQKLVNVKKKVQIAKGWYVPKEEEARDEDVAPAAA